MPNISAPKVMPKATTTVRELMLNSSKAMERTNRVIIVRTAQLIMRGDGKFALTAPSSTAREKKLAASNPKNRMKSDTTSRGKNSKNVATCSSNPATPSTLMPTKINPSHAIQKTNRLTSSVSEGSAAP